MAYITKRGEHQWQAQVRRKGYKPQNKTFESKKEAEAWAKVIESEMVRGVFVSRAEIERLTLGEALERYLKEVTPTKRASARERARILRLKEHPISLRTIASLEASDFTAYRDERLKVVKKNTVRLELAC
jgi:hypothetical protein